YGEALGLQRDIFIRKVEGKRAGERSRDILFLAEHPSVVTMGRRAKEENLLLSEELMRERGVELFHIERGGDVTYHGPGQLVAYPILNLDNYGLGVKDYVTLLEEAVIMTIKHFGISGKRDEGATGVWIGEGERLRKICAIGVKCSRFCTMHGLALNVNTDLRGFEMINPCGFTDRGVTSIAKETGREMDMREVKEIFTECFRTLFQPRIPAQGIS
ncbi:MAG: lipoyl(octanoyl) transferase LipB, partial [Muribaculaceae bacterium]|nr:lipoyl(octanoyl) transferase LipB [Muribaculaceae bacterium]